MANSMRTPLKAASGLGAAKEGSGHFIQQRVSAIALAILAPWFAIAVVTGLDAGYAHARVFMAQPVNALVAIGLLTAGLFHMRLGMQVVIEDYIHATGMRVFLLIANTFAAAALWAAGVFAVLKIALGA